jgi:hypothetical protein
MFTFVAIWPVFGMLGEVIFASSANARTAAPVTGMPPGMGVWATILTIIAMYVAGRATAHFSNALDRTGRVWDGMAMFGLSLIAVGLALILGGTAMSGGLGVAGTTHSPYMRTLFAHLGLNVFALRFLGWLAAIDGAVQGPFPIAGGAITKRETHEVPPAA